MLTQLELVGSSGGLGVDEDSGPGSSPLDELPQYPLEQAEFEYFETSLGDNESYYDVPHSLAVPAPLTTPEYITGGCDAMIYDTNIPSFTNNNLKLEITKPSDDELTISQELAHYQDIKSSEDELKLSQNISHYQPMESCENDIKIEEDVYGYDEFTENFYEGGLSNSNGQMEDFSLSSLHDSFDSDHHNSSEVAMQAGWRQGGNLGSGKGKIGPLQRRALDSIFRVTEKPSRGMALHIASELGLHYLTVKNFFSNGRRRLRRAAAKLSDPERSRRENERRKEKRRLTALASAALSSGDCKMGNTNISRVVVSHSPPLDSPPQKETPIVSPERKALMEKLADKVQRSVAQRSLAAEFDMVQPSTILPQTPTKFPVQPTLTLQGEIMAADLLSQASHDLLTSADQVLVNPSPQDFLTTHTLDLSSAPTPLLHSQTDPWTLF